MQTEGGDFPALILFLDKMVLTILSCESFAGRWLLKQQPNKTVFNRFIENWYQTFSSISVRNASSESGFVTEME